MAGKCRAIPTAPMMAIVVAVVMAAAVRGVVAQNSPGAATSLTTWSSAGCSGYTSTIRACGCVDLVDYAGFQFSGVSADGAASLYTVTGCGNSGFVMFQDTQVCDISASAWRSIYIYC